MSVFTSRPALRWLVPAAVTATVLGGGAALRTLTASADPTLPARSAAQLLVDLQTARLDGLSGTVVQRADLGLPALPVSGQGSSELSSLVSGSRSTRPNTYRCGSRCTPRTPTPPRSRWRSPR